MTGIGMAGIKLQHLVIGPDCTLVILLHKAAVAEIVAGILGYLAPLDLFKGGCGSGVVTLAIESYPLAIGVFKSARSLGKVTLIKQLFTLLFTVGQRRAPGLAGKEG